MVGRNVVQSSKTPGKTKNLHFIDIEALKVQLVDCPGYGYARASHEEKEEWRKFIMKYLMGSAALHRVIMLVDLQVGLQDSDRVLVDLLTEAQQVFMMALTKADKVKNPLEIEVKLKEVVDQMKSAGSLCVPIIHCVSAEGGGYGMYELMADMIYHNDQPNLRIPKKDLKQSMA